MIIKIICFVIFVISYSSVLFALKTDQNKPIQITANQAIVDQKNFTTQFTGDVIITKGSLRINADKGYAKQDAKGEKTLILDGSPVKFEQKQEDGNIIQGQCNKFEFDSKNNLAILSGRAKVKDGKNEVSGETLTYNTKTLVYSARSGLSNGLSNSSSGRVTVILNQTMEEEKNGKTKK